MCLADWHTLSIWDVAQRAISKANTYTFYGAQFGMSNAGIFPYMLTV